MVYSQDFDRNKKIWKIKQLIKALEAASGNGTSMISMIIPHHENKSRVMEMLSDKYNFASNIKSTIDRKSALEAISSIKSLVFSCKIPTNGLIIYAGPIAADYRKYKMIDIVGLDPFRRINAPLFLCDNKFHTEVLYELIESVEKIGFIIIYDNGTLFGTLSGNNREVLHKFTVDLTKKEIAELATQFFIDPCTSQPNIIGLILGGTADDFKTELSQSDMFDPLLQAKIINVIDVSYGGESGFHQAIELSSEILENVRFMHEKKLIGKFFEEIIQDTGKYVFGIDDVMKAFDMGAIETLIVWEDLDIKRWVLKNRATGEIVIKYLNKDQEADQSNFWDSDTSAELKKYEQDMLLLQWLIINRDIFGSSPEFVTNKSQEGSRFCSVFGGIGGILRYQVDKRSFHINSHQLALA